MALDDPLVIDLFNKMRALLDAWYDSRVAAESIDSSSPLTALPAHDTDEHVGAACDEQIPQALLLDGLRPMAGPLNSPAGQVVNVGGVLYVVKASDTAAAWFNAAAAGFDVTVNDGGLFAANDIILIADGTHSTWASIDSIAGDVLTCTHESGDDETYDAGTPVLNYGQSGEGWVEIRADGGTVPRVSIYTHAGAPWTTKTEHARLGNLNDYSAGTFGLVAIAGTPGGTRTQIDPTGVRGYNGATEQFALDSATGKATFGAGADTLDVNGIGIDADTTTSPVQKRTYGFNVSGANFAGTYAWKSSVDGRAIELYGISDAAAALTRVRAKAASGYAADIALFVQSGATTKQALVEIDASGNYVVTFPSGEFNIQGGLNVGSASGAATGEVRTSDDVAVGKGLYVGNSAGAPTDDDIHADGDVDADGDLTCDGTVSTNGGTNKWDLGAAAASAPTPDSHIEIVVDGVTYWLAAKNRTPA